MLCHSSYFVDFIETMAVITTGNGNDNVIRPSLVNNLVFRENDNISTNGGDDTINAGLGLSDNVNGGLGIDHLIIDYSIGDTGGSMIFSAASNGGGIASRRFNSTSSGSIDGVSWNAIEKLTVTGTRAADYFRFTGTINNTLKAGAGDDEVVVDLTVGNIGSLNGESGIDFLIIDLSNRASSITINNPLSITIPGVVVATNFERFKITTGSGNDTILQSGIVNGAVLRQDDQFITGGGNDTVNAGLGARDRVFAGEGIDHLIIDYSIGDTGAGMTLQGSSFYGLATRNVSATNSTILDEVAFTGVDRFTVTGTSKNDTLLGGGINDVLQGGAGNDLIAGRGGTDILTGGSGIDTFQYYSVGTSVDLTDSLLASYDRITDFAIGIDAIDGPNAVAASLVRKLGSVTALTESAIQRVLTTSTFVARGAAVFRFDTLMGSRTFVALNDSIAGFSATRDSIIEITGFVGDINRLGVI
jgi:RTX calcium-binding nonapeptide repeat (4 copies)